MPTPIAIFTLKKQNYCFITQDLYLRVLFLWYAITMLGGNRYHIYIPYQQTETLAQVFNTTVPSIIKKAEPFVHILQMLGNNTIHNRVLFCNVWHCDRTTLQLLCSMFRSGLILFVQTWSQIRILYSFIIYMYIHSLSNDLH